MIETLNMGLVAWDLGTDKYDHLQLANDLVVIDGHDHTENKGVQIPSAGLKDRSVTEVKIALQAVGTPEVQDSAITGAKLADNTVGATKIIDGSVGTPEIANGAVTAGKIDPGYLPVGSILMWGRPDASPPVGIWEVCDGRSWSTVSNAMGYTTGNMPDFRNVFPLGAAATGTGLDPSTPPPVGQYGGSHTVDLTHVHPTPAHTHSVPSHTHSIAAAGAHIHYFPDDDGNPLDVFTRLVGVVTSAGQREALYIPGLHSNGIGAGSSKIAPLSVEGNHDHGAATGSTSGTTGSDGVSVTGSASRDLSAVDKRPAHVGVLFIMRVR